MEILKILLSANIAKVYLIIMNISMNNTMSNILGLDINFFYRHMKKY